MEIHAAFDVVGIQIEQRCDIFLVGVIPADESVGVSRCLRDPRQRATFQPFQYGDDLLLADVIHEHHRECRIQRIGVNRNPAAEFVGIGRECRSDLFEMRVVRPAVSHQPTENNCSISSRSEMHEVGGATYHT